MRRFFKPFEEDEILFKVKVRKGNQSWETICWYSIVGYWKFSGDIFWKRLGFIEERKSWGKWNEVIEANRMPELLLKTEQLFFKMNSDKDFVDGCNRIRRISVADACRRLDNAST